MPVFHTKTIESILEPVASQVSRLVILHEEAEDGGAMPDLEKPVQAVSKAVENLVRVGHETINHSDDLILKQDMPASLRRVTEASKTLEKSSDMIKADPYSKQARRLLIDGARGILQGTSSLLLCFDESEVRKIIRECKKVLDYLAVAEVIESMEDLVQFVKDLSPCLTKVSHEVDARQKELTHQPHREILIRCLDSVKSLAPILICSMKIFIQILQQGGKGIEEAAENRNYLAQRMTDEINEIVRVLQLTTYDEDEWDADDLAVMRKALSGIESKMQAAQDWLADPRALKGGVGEKSLRQILEHALRIAERCLPADRDAIRKAVADISNMVDSLSELRAEGKGTSPQAESLARGIGQRLGDLSRMCARAIQNAERSGIQQPAHTILGKLEQAKRWLNAPWVDDKGLGQSAIRQITEEGRRIAKQCPEPHRTDLVRLCDEVDQLAGQLADLVRRGEGNSPQAKAIAQKLNDKLDELKNKIQSALLQRVVEDFVDINTPLKQFTDAVLAPEGTPNREGNFHDKARNLTEHALRAADTARMVAAGGSNQNKRAVEGLMNAANHIESLTPQLVNAGKIRMEYPTNKAADEHFENLRKQFADGMQAMRNLVDDQMDSAGHLKAIEEAMRRHAKLCEDAIVQNNPQKMVDNTSAIARLANRALMIGKREADNSEDPSFINKINTAADRVQGAIAPMVQDAKEVAANPQNVAAGNQWRNSNKHLLDAVGKLREAVTPYAPPPLPPAPDLSNLNIDRRGGPHGYSSDHKIAPQPPPKPTDFHRDEAPPRPQPPHGGAPPRPPPPSSGHRSEFETDDEGDFDFPVPMDNQPILQAAYGLHQDIRQWSSKDNEIIAAAKRMALLMARLSQLVRGEGGNKKDLIDCAKQIAAASEEVTRAAKKLARECTDKRMRTALLQVCERIPTIGTQLKILSTVKATMLGAQGSEEDQEATEMLVGNAQNLMQSVKDVVRVAEGASIKMRTDSGYTLRWVRKRPWYT
ncbi:vinculin-like isoform X2 [Paramacrobiotus metropolitanus]|uniref:vinculin-like isoform X2 n=1 Tax=Paramacrobiotus metropolitanus TaxID=2943436 RepID=UPI002445CB4D|nr:vinculin-like isoform X2 [Paramacrobiotus metropolitanus]